MRIPRRIHNRPQKALELRLIEHIHRLPAVGAEIFAGAAEQQLTLGVGETHTFALAQRLHQFIDGLRQAQRLQCADDFTIEIDRPRGVGSGDGLRLTFTYLLPILVVINVPARVLAKPLTSE